MERVDKSLALSQYLAFRYVFDDVKFAVGGVKNKFTNASPMMQKL